MKEFAASARSASCWMSSVSVSAMSDDDALNALRAFRVSLCATSCAAISDPAIPASAISAATTSAPARRAHALPARDRRVRDCPAQIAVRARASSSHGILVRRAGTRIPMCRGILPGADQYFTAHSECHRRLIDAPAGAARVPGVPRRLRDWGAVIDRYGALASPSPSLEPRERHARSRGPTPRARAAPVADGDRQREP
jgi:hypothetical protein